MEGGIIILNLSEIIKSQRTIKNLTQSQLADKLLVSNKTVSNWETGKTLPDIDSLIRIVHYFDLSLDSVIKEGSDVMKDLHNKENAYHLQKKLAIIDKIMVTCLILIMLSVMLLLVTRNNRAIIFFSTIFVLVISLMLIIISIYRYWIAYPKVPGLREPLFVPKAIGLGWAVNPRNKLGMIITIITVLLIILIFGTIIFQMVSS